MAELIVEDGTGYANANSWVSVEEADEYHELRGNTRWADYDEDEVKIPALVRAAEYIEQVYATAFEGWPAADGQGLSWPRQYATNPYIPGGPYFDSNVIPSVLKKAQCELALDAINASTGALQELLVNGEGSAKKKLKVGPIEIERFNGPNPAVIRRKTDTMLVSILGTSGLGSLAIMRG